MIFINYIKPHDFYLETNGRIIDVDGYTGGFNLQIAYSTGFVAGSFGDGE